ncbi:MAG: isopenicillin N synthase family oxygenase [Alphaproteobacteria bacterium]|nr:isopenicillin N synthase family oxygenase [Alphaproteobacteria bacterium]
MTAAIPPAIPAIDVAALFGPASRERDAADRAILDAASASGFMTVGGMPASVPHGAAARAALLRVFALDEPARHALLRQKFAPERPNVYRGWFPLQHGTATYKEGIDMGPDVAHAGLGLDPADPLTEPTPLPPEAALPGWRAAVAAYYRGMEELGRMLMRAVARGTGLPETFFDPYFAGGISTLRLIRYPVRTDASLAGADPDAVTIAHEGARRTLIGAPHVDSGFVTLLAQDGVGGLQARGRDGGAWLDVPPAEGTLAVNFGGLLERWTGGRIRATEHRVVSPGIERFSIPFFYEPRVDAAIAPLPLPGAARFEPFLYGDHLWAAMMRFVEFQGLEAKRPPRGGARSAA